VESAVVADADGLMLGCYLGSPGFPADERLRPEFNHRVHPEKYFKEKNGFLIFSIPNQPEKWQRRDTVSWLLFKNNFRENQS